MKHIKTASLKLKNGDIIIGINGYSVNRIFFVNTSDGIMQYNSSEMAEIYDISFTYFPKHIGKEIK